MSGFGPPPGAPAEVRRPGRAGYLAPGRELMDPAARRRYAVSVSARPGIISLAPFGVSDVIDGSIKHVRRNPGPIVGAAALTVAAAMLPAMVLSAIIFAGSWRRTSGLAIVANDFFLSTAVSTAGVAIAILTLGGVLAPAVLDAALGQRISSDGLWRRVRPRLLPLIGSQLLVGVVIAVPIVISVVLVVLAANGGSDAVAVLSAIFLLPAASVVSLWLLGRTVLSAPALMLEQLSPIGALRRAWHLTRGRFWRVLGSQISVGLLAFVIFWFIQLPLYLVLRLFVDMLDLGSRLTESTASLTFTLATLGAGSIVTPVVASATVLLHVDTRMRAEGFDLHLRRLAAGATP